MASFYKISPGHIFPSNLEMQTSDIITAIAGITASLALWVSFRAYSYAKSRRFHDKLMDLRLRIVELRNIARFSQTRVSLLYEAYPELLDKELLDYFQSMFQRSDHLHKMLFREPESLDEKFLEDRIMDIREFEGDINRIQEKIEEIFQKV